MILMRMEMLLQVDMWMAMQWILFWVKLMADS